MHSHNIMLPVGKPQSRLLIQDNLPREGGGRKSELNGTESHEMNADGHIHFRICGAAESDFPSFLLYIQHVTLYFVQVSLICKIESIETLLCKLNEFSTQPLKTHL